jgi:molybdopterin-synthase adenylyltransferase
VTEDRYARQVNYPPIGVAGQARLRAARVLVAGCGGLGAEAAELLARAGVGFLRLVDRDVVEWTNLHRTALYDEADARERRPKAVAAARHLAAIDPGIVVEPLVTAVGAGNVAKLIEGVDLIVDGFDNFAGRYVLNDACVREGLTWVHGACLGGYGVSTTIVPGVTPCLRCLHPELPPPDAAPTCATAGVLGPAAHLTAALEVAQALRWLITRRAPEPPVLVSVDVWTLQMRRVELPPRDPRCPCCGQRRFEFLEGGPPPAGA